MCQGCSPCGGIGPNMSVPCCGQCPPAPTNLGPIPPATLVPLAPTPQQERDLGSVGGARPY
jgi:hypothetical protein